MQIVSTVKTMHQSRASIAYLVEGYKAKLEIGRPVDSSCDI